MKTSISGLLIALVLQKTISITLASPFLYNAAPLFLQSIFRSSSGIPDNGTKNVEDLRNSDEPSKLENLKADRRQFANQQAEDSNSNEAAPNFFQKKIEKILYKLRLVSQLSGPFQFGGSKPEQHDNKEPDDFDFDFDSDEKNDTSTTASHVHINHTTVKPVSTSTEIDKNRPQRFSLNLAKENLKNSEAELVENDLNSGANNEGSVNKVNPGSIGVFLIEMLGTVLTLIYGAAVQNNNENNTVPALI